MPKPKNPSAEPFAHLLGMPVRAESDDTDTEDEERKRRPGETDDEYAKRMEELDKDKEEASDETPDDDDDDTKKEKEKAAKAARIAERARCEKIFSSKAATGRPDVAAHLAFKTDMAADDAISLMATLTTGGKRGGLSAAMSGIKPTPVLGSDAGPGPSADPASAESVAKRIVASADKARGKS